MAASQWHIGKFEKRRVDCGGCYRSRTVIAYLIAVVAFNFSRNLKFDVRSADKEERGQVHRPPSLRICHLI